tara:strand:- start:7771 stop:10494 length:2724 start_codon:yes stop_codon:yes gene_type:complete
MRYQDRIYNSSGNLLRNSTTPLPHTSSDMCVFEIPFFTMSGGSKVDCSEVTCDISGISYNNIFTATTECFITNNLSGDCENTIWETRIYEDDLLSYSATFFTSTGSTGLVPTISNFSGSVVTAFNTLGYDYSFSGTQYTLNQKGFDNLKLNITTSVDISNCETCNCPSGYTETTALDECERLTYTSSTAQGVVTSAVTGDINSGYDLSGVVFLPNVNDYTWPLEFSGSPNQIGAYSGTNFVVDATATVVPAITGGPGLTYYDKPAINNSLWGNSIITNGRMNNAGVKSSPVLLNEFHGFSVCIDAPYSGVYYLGVGTDDLFRFSLNGDTIFDQTSALTIRLPYSIYGLSLEILHFWVFSIELASGKNVFDVEYKDGGSLANCTFEIYSGTTIEALSAMTTELELSAVTMFSTLNEVGELFQIGETIGFSCPTGYVLDTCSGTTSTCVKIEKTPIICSAFTGTCSGVTEVICDLEFSGATSGDTNIYPLTGQTNIDLDFTFTANTSNLTGNTKFSFEVYKYDNNLGLFRQPPKYISDNFSWSGFSGTSAFTTSVPVSTLNIDGDYLVKGFYTYDVCTEIGNLLGETITTSKYKTGDSYGIYQLDRDFYFTAFVKAEKPSLQLTNNTTTIVNSLFVYSSILTGNEDVIAIKKTSGWYSISLNGLTLAKDLDYSLSGNNLTTTVRLSGGTVSGDIFTYVFVNTSDNDSLRLDTIDITSTIVSGVTNGQGSNDVYYNTDKNKYEIYTSIAPSSVNDIILTLNGVTLANNIDYYLSITNDKRIILEGTLVVSDIINVYYITDMYAQGNITTTILPISWSIPTQPQKVNGEFTAEFSDTTNFTNIITSAKTKYVVGVSNYSLNIPLVGESGDIQYYRIKNEKKYIDICNNPIPTVSYSEIIDITIQTNAINSY